jgi:hypothetical protein
VKKTVAILSIPDLKYLFFSKQTRINAPLIFEKRNLIKEGRNGDEFD